MFTLIMTRQGKQTILMVGELARVREKLKMLKASNSGERVSYKVVIQLPVPSPPALALQS